MKSFLIATIFVAFAFVNINQAQAGFLIEPYVGVGMSGNIEDNTDPSSKDELSAGTVFGARLGWTFVGFQLGLEYEISKSEMEVPQFALSGITQSTTNTGVFVGYKFPFLFRVYATYIMSTETEVDDIVIPASVPLFGGASLTDISESGSGTKLGVSYTGLPFLAINLEMLKLNIDESKATFNGSPSVDEEDKDITITQLTLSIPLP